jgi:hypothetical protein
MIVAWQFTARDLPTKRIRPVGCGMIWVRSFALIILEIEQRMDCKRGRPSLRARKSHRTLRDGSFVRRIPGNKLPARIVQFLRNKVRTVDREDGSFHRSRLARRSLPEFKTMGRSRALAPPDTATNPSESWRRVFPYRI